MIQRKNKNTTIMGRILVANACIVGMINYTVVHNTITSTAIKQMKRTIKKYTCGSNSNIRYDNITLQRSHGNIVTLIDIEKHVETLQATHVIKFINKIKTYDDYEHMWNQQLIHIAQKYNLKSVDHVIMCPLHYQNLRITGRTTINPTLLSGLQAMTKMKYTTNKIGNQIHDIIDLPIWYNPIYKWNNRGTPTVFDHNTPFKSIMNKLYYPIQIKVLG